MAANDETRRLTQAHMKLQLGLRASVIRDIMRLFPTWNPFDPDSLEKFSMAVFVLAQQRSTNSAALAARYFQMFKEADLSLTAGKAMALAEPPPIQQVRAAVRATMVSGFWGAIGSGATVEEAREVALTRLSGSVGRMAMNGGRETLTQVIRKDRDYRGRFMRVSDGDPCPFCAMLCGRGPVYLSADRAGAGHKFHDHCGCSIMPYSGGAWPEDNEQLHEQWQAMKAQGGSDLEDWRRFRRDNRVGLQRDRMAERISKTPQKAVRTQSSRYQTLLEQAQSTPGFVSGRIKAIEERMASGIVRPGDAEKLVELRKQLKQLGY